MNPFVLNAVVKNSWIGGGSYYSHSVKPVRVSKPGGVTFNVKIARRYYEAPVTNYDVPLFHYYQLGQLPPHLLEIHNLDDDTWVRTDHIMAENDVLIQMVVENGMSLTPRDVWLRKTGIDNNFIIAVFQNPAFNYGTTQPYLRREENDGLVTTEEGSGIPINFNEYESVGIDDIELVIHFYSNSNYFKPEHRSQFTTNKMMSYVCANPKNLAEVNGFLSRFTEDRTLGWINGNGHIYTLKAAWIYRDDFIAIEIAAYHDLTIKEKIFFPLKNALRYTAKDSGVINRCFRLANSGILNRDDISAFVGIGNADTFKGISVDIDSVNSIRQITNIEISIASLDLLMSKHEFIAQSTEDIQLMFIIRQGGAVKQTPYNRLRLDLLDSLTITQRNRILTQEINFPLWGIENLEKSAPMDFLYSHHWNLTERLIMDNYGLTGISNLVARNPMPLQQRFEKGRRYQTAQVDWAFREELHYRKDQLYLEILPYAQNGELLKSSYRPANFAGLLSFENLPDAKCVEVNLVKWYTDRLEYHSKRSGDSVIIGDDGLFFGFACYVTSSLESGIWTLAEEGLHYKIVTQGKKKTVVWEKTRLTQLGLVGRVVEGGKNVHVITYLNHHSDARDFAEITIQRDTDGHPGIPMANLDVWMDDLLLIEGIDYAVRNSKIFIFLIGKSRKSQIRIRMSGVSPTGSHLAPMQIGWVNNGQIFFGKDTRRLKNKQLRISIAGRMYHRDEVGFGGTSQVTDGVSVGEPFMVKQIYPCLENFMNISTVDEWKKEQQIETQLINFMETVSPINQNGGFARMALTRTRNLVSGIINQLVYNFLNVEDYLKREILGNYTKAQVDTWLTPIRYLIDVDPSQSAIFNATNMLILPHRSSFVSLSTAQLKFIRFVNDNYLQGRVTLNNYIITT